MKLNIRPISHLAALAGIALVLAACAPAAPSPTSPPAKPPAAAPPAAKPAAKPAEKAEAKAPPEWEQEWQRVLAAAKQERQVNVTLPAGADRVPALTEPFTAKYGIPVEFFADGPRIPPKVLAEREAGQYLWDVYVHASTTALASLVPGGAFDPLEPALMLPEVKDPKNWKGGEFEFLDPGRQVLVASKYQRSTLFVSPSQVSPAEFRSYRDLLDPKWKGRILLDEPRTPGPGNATMLFFYLHPELGPDFIRALGPQEMLILKDEDQEVDLLGRGVYPIGLGFSSATVESRIRRGVPIAVVPPKQLREGSDVSTGVGTVALYNRAPHPNAARVYINWVLSKEGQTSFAKAADQASTRVDVPTDHLADWALPQPGALETYTAKALESRRAVQSLLEQVFGPA